MTAPPIVHEVLRSPGQPLDPVTRAFMEPRFGHDFSRVRVHSGAVAEQSARDVNANAYTVGHDIVFECRLVSPGTHEGRRLIAHELTHVVQQSGVDGINVGQSNNKCDLSPIPRLSPTIQRDPPKAPLRLLLNFHRRSFPAPRISVARRKPTAWIIPTCRVARILWPSSIRLVIMPSERWMLSQT